MNAKHVELLQRLEQFQLDSPEATLPFSARLARENNWSSAYAQRVIAEYKRFAFLAAAAGHPVSPSEDVDQAWHLHLVYSENYWKVFCPEVLRMPLHHQPTQGGISERDKFQDWYARTLASYEAFFGERAPLDIWPTPEERRKERHDFVHVDRERNWVIPKPRFSVNRKLAAGLGFGAVAILCSGAMAANNANVFDWRGPDFLKFYCFLFAVCFALALWLRRSLRTPGAAESIGVPELDGYATAFLNGGRVLAMNTAVANLANRKALHIDTKSGKVTSLMPEPEFSHELERGVYAAATSPAGKTIADVRVAAKPFVTLIAEDLKAHGLVVADATARTVIAAPLAIAGAAIAVGVIKLCVGVYRGKPVGFLIALIVVSLIASLIAFARRPLRSRKGDAVLDQLRERYAGPKELGRAVSGVSAPEFAMMVGLFGMTALPGVEFDPLRSALRQNSGSSSGCGTSGCGSSGCSSSGGGSSCGGGGCGGGGCGGCGGS